MPESAVLESTTQWCSFETKLKQDNVTARQCWSNKTTLQQHAHLCQEGIWSEAGCQFRRACSHLQNGCSQDLRLGHHLQCPPAHAAACHTSDSSSLAICFFSDSKHCCLWPLQIRLLCGCCWPLSLLRQWPCRLDRAVPSSNHSLAASTISTILCLFALYRRKWRSIYMLSNIHAVQYTFCPI